MPADDVPEQSAQARNDPRLPDWPIEEDLAYVPPLTLADVLWLRTFVKAHSSPESLQGKPWREADVRHRYATVIVRELRSHLAHFGRAGLLPTLAGPQSRAPDEAARFLVAHLLGQFTDWRASVLLPARDAGASASARQAGIAARLLALHERHGAPVQARENLVRGVRMAAHRMRLSHLVPEKLTAEEVLEALFLADGRRLHYTGKDGRVRWNFFRLVEMLRPGWEAERRAAATVSLETQEDRQDDLAPSSPFAGPGAEDVPARLEGVQRLRDLETLAGLDELEQRVVAITLDLLAEEGADGRPVGGGLALGSRDHAAKLTAAGLPISHEWLRRKWAALAEKLRAVG